MSQSTESSQLSTPCKNTARKSTATPSQLNVYLNVPSVVKKISKKSTTRLRQNDVNRIDLFSQGSTVLRVRHRNILEDLESKAEQDSPPSADDLSTPALSLTSTTGGGDENNQQTIVQQQPIRKSPDTSSGYSSKHSSQVAVSKPDPLVRMNERIRRRINRRYEASPGPRLVARGRGKDERLLRQALMRKRKNDESEWRRLKAHLHNDDVRCPKTDIPLAPFVRLVRELARKECNNRGFNEPIKFQHAALLAIRDAVEGFMVNMFEQCSLFIAHAGRVTLMNKDIFLARRLWNGTGENTTENNSGNVNNNN